MASHSDGTLRFGSQTTVFSDIANVDYICEQISVEFPTREIRSNDEVGEANRRVLVDEPLTGSMTVQHPSTTSAMPGRGATFTLLRASAANVAATVKFTVAKVGLTENQNDESKFTVDFLETLNP
jgi:hypothetical protein